MKLKEPQPVVPNPISTFLLHREDYKIDPTYQRAPGVWEKWMEQYLIDTILRGYSIPVIFLHKKGGKKFIVDGQQRLKTIWKFYDDNLELSEKYSSDIIKENNGAKKYSKLLPEYQDRFDRYPLPLSFLEDYKDEEIRSTFKRLQTSKALTPGEKLNAFPGKIVPTMRELGSHIFFKEIVGFGVKRYKNYKLAATFLFLEKEGFRSISPTYIYEFFGNNPTIDTSSSIYKKVNKVLNYLERTFKNRTGELSNQAWAVSVYLLTSYLLEKYVMKDQCGNIKNFMIDFYQKIARVVSTGGPELIKFNNAVSRGTNSEESIKYRFSLMVKSYIEEYHPQELDEVRIFDRDQKLTIYRRDSGICQECGKKLKFGETSTHYHHIDPYIEGGRTEVERGLLVCRDCHQNKIHGSRLKKKELSNFYKFYVEDFLCLTFKPNYDVEKRLQQLYKLKVKLQKLDTEMWKALGRLNFISKKFGRITKKGENVWFAYYDHEDKANHANLNFAINNDGFYIDVNAETSRSFRQFVDSIKKRNNQFDSLINNIGFDFKVVLWTKLPLAPERQNKFYWKEIYEINKKNINSKNILKKIDLIEQDFEQIVKKMISEVESSYKYSPDNTKYFKRTYISGKKTKKPLSSCVIRFRYLINKDRILGMERKNLIKEIIEVSKEFKKIIDFINR